MMTAGHGPGVQDVDFSYIPASYRKSKRCAGSCFSIGHAVTGRSLRERPHHGDGFQKNRLSTTERETKDSTVDNAMEADASFVSELSWEEST
jgi:hypothetical protein